MTALCRYNNRQQLVSIHTPTWGVTLRGTREYAYPRVSIHTPTWGVTYSKDQNSADIVFQSTHLHEVWHYQATKFLRHRCFNPHTYMRCDEDAKTVDLATFVSIHTPTWGVTGKAVYLLSINEFQSTHLHEVWQSTTNLRGLQFSFNPHTYMRCDYGYRALRPTGYCFNPHTYMRCDNDLGEYSDTTYVSIHTPTWGVTYNGLSSSLL